MKRHPEQLDDEIFVGNIGNDQLPEIGWESKRAGRTAYDRDGTPVPYMMPVFIKRADVEALLAHQERAGTELAAQTAQVLRAMLAR